MKERKLSPHAPNTLKLSAALFSVILTVLLLSLSLSLPILAVQEEEWFIGTWSASEYDSASAVKIESYSEANMLIISQIEISSVSGGNALTKLKGYYTAEYTTAPDGEYIIIASSRSDSDGRYFNSMKLFKPDGDNTDTLDVIVAPGELSEMSLTWYRRDSGKVSGSQSEDTPNGNADTSADDSKEAQDDVEPVSGKLSPGKIAIAAAALVAVGAGVAGVASVSAKKNSGSDERTYDLIDPATGSVSRYIYDDSSGQWVSSDGSSILDMSQVRQWKSDRSTDRTAADEAMKRMRSRTAGQDIANTNAYNSALAQQRHEDYINKTGIKYNVYNGNTEELRTKIGNEMGKSEIEGYEQLEYNEEYKAKEQYAGTVKKVADVSVDVLTAAVPAMKPVQALYYGGRNLTSNLTDAVVNGKDTWSAVRKSVGETVVEVAQVNVKGVGYKFVAFTAGDAYKKVLQSIDQGRISSDELSSAASAGAQAGLKKAVVAETFARAGNTFQPSKVFDQKISKALDSVTKKAIKGRENLQASYSSGAIDAITYRAAVSNVNAKLAAESRSLAKLGEEAHKFGEQLDPVARGVFKFSQKAVNEAVTGTAPSVQK